MRGAKITDRGQRGCESGSGTRSLMEDRSPRQNLRSPVPMRLVAVVGARPPNAGRGGVEPGDVMDVTGGRGELLRPCGTGGSVWVVD